MKALIICISIAVAIVLLAMTVFFVTAFDWGLRYYESRYMGEDYFAVIPLDYDMTSVPQYSMKGREVGTGINYTLAAYNGKGEPKTVTFTVHDIDSRVSFGERQPQPGMYLRISASKQIVVRWRVVEQSDIPETALAQIGC
jgi:uncharacterized protein (TIGR01655 family)